MPESNREGRAGSREIGCTRLVPRLCLGTHCARGSASRGRASKAVGSQAEPGNQRRQERECTLEDSAPATHAYRATYRYAGLRGTMVEAKARTAKSRTVLIVEDDDGVANLERIRLERANYKVLVASDAAEALQKL